MLTQKANPFAFTVAMTHGRGDHTRTAERSLRVWNITDEYGRSRQDAPSEAPSFGIFVRARCAKSRERWLVWYLEKSATLQEGVAFAQTFLGAICQKMDTHRGRYLLKIKEGELLVEVDMVLQGQNLSALIV